ncbi:MAG TPA: NIL domain-containing protein [Verrucomicrobiae bacterium]
MAKETKYYWLTYPIKLLQRPLLSELSRRFALATHLRSVNVTENHGQVSLELSGDNRKIAQAIRWIRKQGVEVDQLVMGTPAS